MSLRGFERRLEGMVEGTFARLFRTSVRPVELGRRIVRLLDAERTIDVGGRTVVPNVIEVRLSVVDHERFVDVESALERELEEEARAIARQNGWAFMGPLEVVIVPDEKLRVGRSAVSGRLVAGIGGTGAGSLVFPDGRRVALGERIVSMGRLSDCDIVLNDAKASRRHAEVHPDGDGYVLVDLGSTNGTLVNGLAGDSRRLNDGDEITVGGTVVVFEAS
jgi:hypothetical protein